MLMMTLWCDGRVWLLSETRARGSASEVEAPTWWWIRLDREFCRTFSDPICRLQKE